MSRTTRVVPLLLFALSHVAAPGPLAAQERGAAALAQAIDGLGVTARVLMVGAHPDDEDTQLIAWLARGRHVATAYLSLTRGDGGQNLIGNELGEALGVLRTAELLAARRIDGGEQFFTRAYDFGFSKSAEETFTHWPRDTLLGDVVRVVRAFRPHVIVSLFSGTPRDGHGHHQVSGMLAREAYDVAGDTVRFTRAAYGVPWTPLKFYRSSRGDRESATLAIDVGEYDPVLGRSFAEIAGESRSQHKSQGFGALERKGPVFSYVRREASRVVAPEDATTERSIFDGIDTAWGRFADVREPYARRLLDSLPAAVAAARAALDVRRPAAIVPMLARLRQMLAAVCPEYQTGRTSACADITATVAQRRTATDAQHRTATDARPQMTRWTTNPDLERTVDVAAERAGAAAQLAAGVVVEAEAAREVAASDGAPLRVVVRFHNRGTDSVSTSAPYIADGGAPRTGASSARYLPPGTSWTDTVAVAPSGITQPWWLAQPRVGDMFAEPVQRAEHRHRGDAASVSVSYQVEGTGAILSAYAPVVYRYADAVQGDVSRPLGAAPAVSVTLVRPLEMVPANTPIRREIQVALRSADVAARQVTVRLSLPPGLAADSASRTVTLADYDALATVAFTLHGSMVPGRDTIRVVAESGGETFATGYQLVDYPHIRPQRLYRPALLAVEAVDLRLPAGLTVAYVPGVSDNSAPVLRQLGVDVLVVEPAQLATTELAGYTAVVVGPRAYEAHPEVMAARAKLLDYARAGGTLVVQYQQYEVQRPGVVPYPMTVARPHDRVTVEGAPVTLAEPAAPVLAGPNPITLGDFDGWVQERSLYMPRTFDERYAAPLEMHDPGEPDRRGALLIAPLGRGMYVYTALSLFRQLPAGVPGAARLFVNLLTAGESRAAAAP